MTDETKIVEKELSRILDDYAVNVNGYFASFLNYFPDMKQIQIGLPIRNPLSTFHIDVTSELGRHTVNLNCRLVTDPKENHVVYRHDLDEQSLERVNLAYWNFIKFSKNQVIDFNPKTLFWRYTGFGMSVHNLRHNVFTLENIFGYRAVFALVDKVPESMKNFDTIARTHNKSKNPKLVYGINIDNTFVACGVVEVPFHLFHYDHPKNLLKEIFNKYPNVLPYSMVMAEMHRTFRDNVLRSNSLKGRLDWAKT